MKNFKKKIDLIERLRDDLDDHIWSTFKKYKKARGILFSSPDDWHGDHDSIYFYGSDGCMGCYDPMHLSIPMKYFTDPNAFEELEQEIKAEKKAKADAKIKAQQEAERKEYLRLKEQFEN